MGHPLAGVEAKIDRAHKHLDELHEAIETYLNEDNCRFTGEQHPDPETGYAHRIYYLEVDRFPPDEEWGPIIGDVVHNLRSALDHLAWQLATPEARSHEAAHLRFPVHLPDPTNPSSDVGRRAHFGGQVRMLREDARALVERAQPDDTGDLHHPLWLLERLWNVDKHRTLHTAGLMFSSQPDDPANPFGYGTWQTIGLAPPERRTEMGRAWGTFNEMLEMQVDAQNAQTRDVTLRKPVDAPGEAPWTREYPFPGLPLRQMLRRIDAHIDSEILAPARELDWEGHAAS